MDIFDCAIKMKEQAMQYYQNLAERTSVAELKNLFNILAASEQEHHQALMQLRERINPQKGQFEALQGAACTFQPLLTKDDIMAQLKDDPDGYQHVVKEEESAVKRFEDLALQAKDKKTRETFLMVAAEERKHLGVIENIYAFVEEPKNYLVSGEFSNLKEY
jgi:rubrerythrin